MSTDYIPEGQTEEEAKAAEAFAQAEFDEEERLRQADMLAFRIGQFQPHEGLKRLRSRCGMTQEAFAKSAGVTRRTYQFYESGQKQIPSGVLTRLSATYDVDLHALFTDRPHSENLRVISETAKLAADVTVYLSITFRDPPMRLKDMQLIAMEVARSHPIGTPIANIDVFEAIYTMTGEEYAREEVMFLGAEE